MSIVKAGQKIGQKSNFNFILYFEGVNPNPEWEWKLLN